MATEKELYNLQISVQKVLNGLEVPLKIKHARAIIIYTFKTSECSTLWEILKRQPLMEQRFTAWKFCHLIHKILREGHRSIIKESHLNKQLISQIGAMWMHLNDGVGECIELYTKLLLTKIDFHRRNPNIPGNLTIQFDVLEDHSRNDINYYFELAVEVLDYFDDIFALEKKVFQDIQMFRMSSMTSQGQCRLAPLIPLIQDSNKLYDLTVRLMFKLHSNLSIDILQGLNKRFCVVFSNLKEFYSAVKPLAYFSDILQLPLLPESAPNFNSEVDFGSYIPPTITIPASHDQFACNLQESEIIKTENEPEIEQELYIKNQHIQRLQSELTANIKKQNLEREEINSLRSQNRLLSEKCFMLESDLIKTQNINLKLGDSANFQMCLEEKLQSEEQKHKLNEEKFDKLKACYTQIRDEHIQLLRKNAETLKLFSNLQTDSTKLENENSSLNSKLSILRKENDYISEKIISMEDMNIQIDSLSQKHSDLQDVYDTLLKNYNDVSSKYKSLETQREKEINELMEKSLENSRISARQTNLEFEERECKLKKEINELTKDSTLKSTECNKLKEQLEKGNVERKQLLDSLSEQMTKWKKMEEQLIAVENYAKHKEDSIKNDLDTKLAAKDTIISEIESEKRVLLHSVISASEEITLGKDCKDVVQIFCDTSTVFEELSKAHMDYDLSPNAFLGSFGWKIISTAHYLGVLRQKCLDLCYACPSIQAGEEIRNNLNSFFDNDILELFNMLKQLQSYDETKNKIGKILEKLHYLKSKIKTVSMNETRENISDQLETELGKMDKAVEEASQRISEMLSNSRSQDTGLTLEVNEKILDCCTKLMKSIMILVQKSRTLQMEIVKLEKGSASAKEFYKRNNQWTDGLISAAKNVGIGANLLVEAANKAISGDSENWFAIIAATQEIAASTTQLVVASRVKASKNSKHLEELSMASKAVCYATGVIVATVKDLSIRLDTNEDFDVTKLTINQLKTREIEIQVKILELEQSLQKERQKLANFRKKSYNIIKDKDN